MIRNMTLSQDKRLQLRNYSIIAPFYDSASSKSLTGTSSTSHYLQNHRIPKTITYTAHDVSLADAPLLYTLGARSSGLLGSVLGSRAGSVGHSSEIAGSSDQMVLDTGSILDSASSDVDHTMLLCVVTLSGNVGGHHLAVAETDSGGLSLGRVGLLGLENQNSQNNALSLRARLEIGRLLSSVRHRSASVSLDLVDGLVSHGESGQGGAHCGLGERRGCPGQTSHAHSGVCEGSSQRSKHFV